MGHTSVLRSVEVKMVRLKARPLRSDRSPFCGLPFFIPALVAQGMEAEHVA
jgi:hypothetical protein